VSWDAGRIPAGEMTRRGPPTTAFEWIGGHVNAKYADAVEVRFTDGDSQRLDLAWVSEPIDAGFFHYSIPDDRRRAGHEIESVVALDAAGRVITEQSRAARAVAPPADALVDQKRAVVRLGEIVIWEAPTRYEGRCTWLEYRETQKPVGPCMPRGYERQAVLSIELRPLAGRSVLVGSCGYAAVELSRPGGGVRAVRCVDGIVLAEVRREELAGHARAVDARGRPQSGSQIPLSRLKPTGSAR
jgi:hypothetical protein